MSDLLDSYTKLLRSKDSGGDLLMEVGSKKGEECSSDSITEEKIAERESGWSKEAWQGKMEAEDSLAHAKEQSKSGTDLELSSFNDMEYLYPLQQGVAQHKWYSDKLYTTTCYY